MAKLDQRSQNALALAWTEVRELKDAPAMRVLASAVLTAAEVIANELAVGRQRKPGAGFSP